MGEARHERQLTPSVAAQIDPTAPDADQGSDRGQAGGRHGRREATARAGTRPDVNVALPTCTSGRPGYQGAQAPSNWAALG